MTLGRSSSTTLSSRPSTRWPSSDTSGSRRSSQAGSHHVAADDLEPRMAAAATVTVFELLGKHDDDADPAEALAAVDRALQFISGGISALR